MRSYSSTRVRPDRLVRQALTLRRFYGDADAIVRQRLERVREVENVIAKAYGRDLSDLDILDVGPGQLLTQIRYFSRQNRAVGIDQDVIAHGLSPRRYVEMLRINGPQRTCKTIARKLLGVDAGHNRALRQQLDLRKLPRVAVRAMQAEHMEFADDSFDVVYALAVFQHVAHPEEVLRQMVRVLRDGGVLYLDFILYTSQTGAHDLRAGEEGSGLPRWAHLRPAHKSAVSQSAYLNQLRLPEWRDLFDRVIPGATVSLKQSDGDAVLREAERLHARGELVEYTLEELCTTKVVVVWRKPESSRQTEHVAHGRQLEAARP